MEFYQGIFGGTLEHGQGPRRRKLAGQHLPGLMTTCSTPTMWEE
jgi:hypothetical protein